MDVPQIDEIAGRITTTKAMAILKRSHPQIMNYIKRGLIAAVKWEDRFMLDKADVERLSTVPMLRGRPPK